MLQVFAEQEPESAGGWEFHRVQKPAGNWTHCPFTPFVFWMLAPLPLSSSQTDTQPIIIFCIHCVEETNMFFIVLFLAVVFLARENTLLVPEFF